ncbi:Serine protease, partial [Globisporangium splendens]
MRRAAAQTPSRVFVRASSRSAAADGAPSLGRRLWIAHRACGQQHRPLLCSNGVRSFVSFIPMANPSVPREHRPPPPPLPEPQYFHLKRDNCTIEYIDIKPVSASAAKDQVTMVLVHGAPGTYHDFRHIIPLLQQHRDSSTFNMRIIGINLPGFGRSTVDEKAYLDQISAVPAARLTLQALQGLCVPTENVFVMGHSFGAHAALNLTALNQELCDGDQQQHQVNFKGMVFLAPAGCRPHRVLRPKENAAVIRLLRSSNPLVASTLAQVIKLLYTRMLGFSRENPASHFVAGIVRAGTTDFQVVTDHVLATRSTIPSFVAWSSSDEYMEDEIPVELAQMCHPGPRIAFTGGGHNIQKTRADFLADQVLAWIHHVLHPESATSKKCSNIEDVQVVP